MSPTISNFTRAILDRSRYHGKSGQRPEIEPRCVGAQILPPSSNAAGSNRSLARVVAIEWRARRCGCVLSIEFDHEKDFFSGKTVNPRLRLRSSSSRKVGCQLSGKAATRPALGGRCKSPLNPVVYLNAGNGDLGATERFECVMQGLARPADDAIR